MLGDERLELPDQVAVPAEREIGVDPLDQGAQVKLLEPADLVAGERLVGEVGERRAAPERERLAQQQRSRSGSPAACALLPFFELLPEAVDVELARLDTERITSRLRLQTVVAQDAAQLRDIVLEDLRRRRRRPLVPELVDQPVGRKGLVRMDQQKREQRPLLAAPERELSSLVADLERTEDAEIHSVTGDRTTRRRKTRSRISPMPSRERLTAAWLTDDRAAQARYCRSHPAVANQRSTP